MTLLDTVVPYYPWGREKPVSVVWRTATADANKEGTYQVQGVATDFLRKCFPCSASVFVGALTVTDPASATVLFGSDAGAARKTMEGTPVYAHDKASPAIQVDPQTVTWDSSDLKGKLDRAKEGSAVGINGTLATG